MALKIMSYLRVLGKAQDFGFKPVHNSVDFGTTDLFRNDKNVGNLPFGV